MTTPMEPVIDGWQRDVQALWEQGQRQGAIDLLLSRLNALAPPLPRVMGIQFSYYLFLLGDLATAESFLRRLVAAHPSDPQVLENLAVVLSRQEKNAEALPLWEAVTTRRPQSINAWDGLANCRADLNQFDGARQAGEESLRRKDAATRPLQGWNLPAVEPAAFLADRPQRHVIAFSLWGSQPRYLRGALRNLLLIPELFPGWTARFYVDATVPQESRELVPRLGGEVALQPDGLSLRQKLCWRFQVANDPGVGRFAMRDCDSVVSLRERHAVEEWVAS